MVKHLPDPQIMGLPLEEWRPFQEQAVWDALDSRKRFVGINAPTGSGKSAIARAIQVMMQSEGRVPLLTSTKGLMRDTYLSRFPELQKVEGQSNYICNLDMVSTVDRAVCHSGLPCDLKRGGCGYYDDYYAARIAQAPITNYALWLYVNAYGEGLGAARALILDEAHAAVGQLSSFLTVEFGPRELAADLGGPPPADPQELEQWLSNNLLVTGARAQSADAEIRLRGVTAARLERARHYRSLGQRLDRLSRSAQDWVREVDPFSGWVKWSAVWPGRYGESLWQGIPKIVLMSATLTRRTLHMLGIAEGEYDMFEYPSTFPVVQRPFTFVPSVKLSVRSGDNEIAHWIAVIDAIMDHNPGVKGILHTGSYPRAELLARAMRTRERLFTHTKQDLRQRVEEFKRLRPESGKVMTSPALTTGWDFPGNECRFQIIAKIPFPDSRGPIMQAREAEDPHYGAWIASQDLQQAAGRGNRFDEDWCETYLVDSNWRWFRNAYRRFFSRWFLEAMRTADVNNLPQQLGAHLKEYRGD